MFLKFIYKVKENSANLKNNGDHKLLISFFWTLKHISQIKTEI